MTERHKIPPLPRMEDYTGGIFDFEPVDLKTSPEIGPGAVLQFAHKSSGKIYIFECLQAAGSDGSPAQGWLSMLKEGKTTSLRELFGLDVAATRPEAVVFVADTPTAETTKLRISAPYSEVEMVLSVPEIARHLQAETHHKQEMELFRNPQAQEVLKKAAQFFLDQAESAAGDTSADGYGIAARAITQELIQRP